MAGRSDIEAGRAFVTLYVKNSAFMKGLKDVEKQLSSWGTSIMKVGAGLTAVGTTMLGPIIAGVTLFASFGSQLNDASTRTGVAASELAKYAYAAEQTGASLEDVEKALRKMAQNGYSVRQFEQIGRAIAAIPDPAQRAEAAIAMFGKSGTMLLPMLADLDQLKKRAEQLGIAPSQAAVEMADTLGDTFDDIKTVGKAAFFEIGEAVAPVLLPALEAVRGVAVAVKNWIRENKEVAKWIMIIGGGLVAVGTAVVAAGAVITGLAGAVGLVASAIGVMASVATAVLSPIGLIIAGIVAAIAAVAVAAYRGGQVFAWMGKAFGPSADYIFKAIREMGEIFHATWDGMADAMASGDLKLAATIAFQGVNVAWAEANSKIATDDRTWRDDLKESWRATYYAIAQGANTAATAISTFFVMNLHGVKVLLLSVAEVMAQLAEKAGSMLGITNSKAASEGIRTIQRSVGSQAWRDLVTITDKGREISKNLDQDFKGTMTDDRKDSDERIAKWKEEIEKARADLEKSKSTAKAERDKMQSDLKSKMGDMPELAFGALGAAGGGIRSGGVSGTFSATAAAAMGQNLAPTKELVKHAKEQEKLQKKIEQNTRNRPRMRA